MLLVYLATLVLSRVKMKLVLQGNSQRFALLARRDYASVFNYTINASYQDAAFYVGRSRVQCKRLFYGLPIFHNIFSAKYQQMLLAAFIGVIYRHA